MIIELFPKFPGEELPQTFLGFDKQKVLEAYHKMLEILNTNVSLSFIGVEVDNVSQIYQHRDPVYDTEGKLSHGLIEVSGYVLGPVEVISTANLVVHADGSFEFHVYVDSDDGDYFESETFNLKELESK